MGGGFARFAPLTTRVNAFFTEACLYAVLQALFLHISWERVLCCKRLVFVEHSLCICHCHGWPLPASRRLQNHPRQRRNYATGTLIWNIKVFFLHFFSWQLEGRACYGVSRKALEACLLFPMSLELSFEDQAMIRCRQNYGGLHFTTESRITNRKYLEGVFKDPFVVWSVKDFANVSLILFSMAGVYWF